MVGLQWMLNGWPSPDVLLNARFEGGVLLLYMSGPLQVVNDPLPTDGKWLAALAHFSALQMLICHGTFQHSRRNVTTLLWGISWIVSESPFRCLCHKGDRSVLWM